MPKSWTRSTIPGLVGETPIRALKLCRRDVTAVRYAGHHVVHDRVKVVHMEQERFKD